MTVKLAFCQESWILDAGLVTDASDINFLGPYFRKSAVVVTYYFDVFGYRQHFEMFLEVFGGVQRCSDAFKKNSNISKRLRGF